MKDNYDDIIGLPHHVSKTHRQMSISNRAAQFAPFAALTGYGDAVKETARLTDSKIELDENSKEILDDKLMYIRSHLNELNEISITYFVKDEKKEGGSYQVVTGRVKKISTVDRSITMQDGSCILVENIIDIER